MTCPKGPAARQRNGSTGTCPALRSTNGGVRDAARRRGTRGMPGAIGFGGAGGCLAIARDSSLSLPVRVLLCGVITLLCWGLLIVVLGGVAAFSGRLRGGG